MSSALTTDWALTAVWPLCLQKGLVVKGTSAGDERLLPQCQDLTVFHSLCSLESQRWQSRCYSRSQCSCASSLYSQTPPGGEPDPSISASLLRIRAPPSSWLCYWLWLIENSPQSLEVQLQYFPSFLSPALPTHSSLDWILCRMGSCVLVLSSYSSSRILCPWYRVSETSVELFSKQHSEQIQQQSGKKESSPAGEIVFTPIPRIPCWW